MATIALSAQIEEIKKDMVVTAKRVNFWLKMIFCGLLFFLAIGVVFFMWNFWVSAFVFWGVFLFLFSFALFGLITVQPEDRIMVEFLGRAYCVKGPGLRWICPVLMRKRMIVFTWEQSIKLFPKGVHIDFKNGGKAELVEPVLWVQLIGAGTTREEENVLKVIYSVDDWEGAIRESVETALRTHLNNLTVDETLTAIFSPDKASWWEELIGQFPVLNSTIQGYGMEPKRLTISDFNWDEDVVKTRQRIFQEERSIALAKLSVKAAKDEVLQKALESGGLYGEIVRILMQKKYGLDRKEAMLAAESLVLYFKGAETKSLVDVRTPSGGDFASVISSAIAMVRGSRLGGKKPEEPSDEE